MGEIGGRQGVFPDNFVKLLEVEKEVILARGHPCKSFLFTVMIEAEKVSKVRYILEVFCNISVCVFAETKEAASSQRSLS